MGIRACLTLTLILSLLAAYSVGTAAEELSAHDPKRCSPDGIAVGGYDLVSYHVANKAVKGSEQWRVERDDLSYLFASANNLELFKADPERYLPLFGGWCAASLAENTLTCPDYDNFIVENNELLLFEIYGFTNGRYVWEKNPEKNRAKAQENYDQYFAK